MTSCVDTTRSKEGAVRGLADKNVLISGGSGGIGEATARRFLEEGSRVHICGLYQDEVDSALQRLSAFGRVSGEAADVTDPEAVGRFVANARAAMGAIDVLANNAGTAWRETFLDITPEHWDQMIRVNLRGSFLVAQAVARAMVEQTRGGSIINMASTNGLGGEVDYAHYNAAKAGVVLMTMTMAIELGPASIRVNAICPGAISTPLNKKNPPVLRPPEDPLANLAKPRIPLGRRGLASEVAAVYAFLASDDASYITGAEMKVDGGQLAVM
jgi:NAD(P)-dependent dehydrogenase (short-subunit alcohol dehydrogenase family)